MSTMAKQPGFTIVELLIVIVVIGILAAISIVAFNGVQNKASKAVIDSDLHNATSQLEQYRTSTSSVDTYPSTLATANLTPSYGTVFHYSYNSTANTYCLDATNSSGTFLTTSSNRVVASGSCPTAPAGYESAPIASGASTSFDGYSPVQPSSCPTEGGSWIKVPGNSLYGTTNGFCVQQYPASNVSSVATSKAAGPRWTAMNQPTAKTYAEAVSAGSHLFSEFEWMTMATNAAAQPQNWSGGAVGSGTLSVGVSSAAYGGVSFVLSNGQTIYFDTGTTNSPYYTTYEFTCYTGPSANNCGLAAQSQPIPQNAYYTDQFGYFTSYGTLPTNADGRYYGDPRYGNPALSSSVTSARNTGLGYLRSLYSSGSTQLYSFTRGYWTGSNSAGLYTLYIYTLQTYAHAQYGFRAAK